MFSLNIYADPPADKPPKRTTKPEAGRQLTAILDQHRPLIISHVDYPDTARFLLDQWPDTAILRLLRRTNGHKHGDTVSQPRRTHAYPPYVCYTDVQRPKTATLTIIANMLPGNIVSYLHDARDHLTRSQADGQTLATVLGLFLALKWHGEQRTGQSFDTLYFAARTTSRPGSMFPRPSRRNGAIYGDKLSPITNTHCGHVEIRYARPVLLKRGIKTAADLIDHNPSDWLNYDLQFINLAGKLVDKRVDARVAQDHQRTGQPKAAIRRELQREICRAIDPNDTPSWHDLLDRRRQDLIDRHPILRDPTVRVTLPFDVLLDTLENYFAA